MLLFTRTLLVACPMFSFCKSNSWTWHIQDLSMISGRHSRRHYFPDCTSVKLSSCWEHSRRIDLLHVHAGARNQKVLPIVHRLYLTKNLVHIVIWPITPLPDHYVPSRLPLLTSIRAHLSPRPLPPAQLVRAPYGVFTFQCWCRGCKSTGLVRGEVVYRLMHAVSKSLSKLISRDIIAVLLRLVHGTLWDECTGKFCKLRSGLVLSVTFVPSYPSYQGVPSFLDSV